VEEYVREALARLRLRPTRPSRGKTCTTGAEEMMAQSVAGTISRHVRLTVEGIDRMYLNVRAGLARLSLPTKISKTTPCKVAWRSLAWML
jgi:hypothetical protein